MSNHAEKDLASFLDALCDRVPDVVRKELEHGLSSLTQDERSQWLEWVGANPVQYETLSREHSCLLSRIPGKLREYRRRERQDVEDSVRLAMKSLFPIPKGRPRLDALASEMKLLKDADQSYAKISQHLNREHGEGTTTAESVRHLLKSRNAKSGRIASPPDKIQK
jgi:hypothetical protein